MTHDLLSDAPPKAASSLAPAEPSAASDPGGRTTPAEPIVSILVISYNTRDMTLACLASLKAETTVPYEVIVLDNASPDGSAEAIATGFPEMRLIASAENLGFAKGNNVAGVHARGRYILLLNPDTLVLDRAVDRLVAFAERTPQAGIWGGRTVFEGGALNPTNVFGDLTLWSMFCRTTGISLVWPQSGLFNSEDYGGWARDSERPVDVVSGCFFLVTRALWERMGGFDLSYVMYGEEVDLCRRARRAGLASPRMTPEATIVHHAGASSKRRSDRMVLVLKSKATLIRRYLPAWQRPLALGLLDLWPLSRRWGGRLIAAVTGRAGPAEAAAHWTEVWEARADWRGGFPTLPHPERA